MPTVGKGLRHPHEQVSKAHALDVGHSPFLVHDEIVAVST